MSDKKMTVAEARHLAYITGGSVHVLAQLEEIIRADERSAVDAKWEKRMGELVDAFKQFTDDRSFAAHRVGLLFASKELTAAITAAKGEK